MTRTSSDQDVVEGAWKGNDQVMATEVRGAKSVEKSPQRGEWKKEVTQHSDCRDLRFLIDQTTVDFPLTLSSWVWTSEVNGLCAAEDH